jgi:hypothetical protein
MQGLLARRTTGPHCQLPAVLQHSSANPQPTFSQSSAHPQAIPRPLSYPSRCRQYRARRRRCLQRVRIISHLHPKNNELVASFPECRRFSPWPQCCKPRAAYAPSAARKMCGTPRQSLGRNARDRHLFCSVLQKCTGRTYLHFLLTPQEVRAIGKTRNQFMVGSVAAQGVAWVKPRACAMRVP